MQFLQAHRLAAGLSGGEPLPFLLAMSGTAGPLDLFLRAHAAERGLAARVRTLPFNTLAQALTAPAEPGEREVFLLLPWDFVPELDWRSGVPAAAPALSAAEDSARIVAERLRARGSARVVYLPAPVPPLLLTPAQDEALAATLRAIAFSLAATVLSAEPFSLTTYLGTGCPVSGRALSEVAERIVEAAAAPPPARRKVLVTDFDEVLWAGIIGEDGPDGVTYGPSGTGYRHFIYQTYLAKLQHEGVLIAGVSRNDPEIALAPLRSGRTVLGESQFVCVVASYLAKSAQIRQIAEQLGLGLDAFVFVDDNPVELAEVAGQLPTVACLRFPSSDEELGALLAELSRHFAAPAITTEDRDRTELYRRRLAGLVPSEAAGGDLTAFLQQLGMKLTIHGRSQGDRTRAVQLINKTNQFNLNGRRWDDCEVAATLAAGGQLWTASLSDRHGAHGEILSCLTSADGTVEALVLSCRVFQRRVEHAFLAWLCARTDAPIALRYAATPRNEPLRRFLVDVGLVPGEDGPVTLDASRFAEAYGSTLGLFQLELPAAPTAVG